MDLKISRTGRVYERLPVEKIRRWLSEGRVLPDDLVRPVGGQNWLRISMAPEFAVQEAAADAVTPTARPEASGDLGIAAPARSRPRRRRRLLEDGVLDMTPMIDVTFQMLIFFMFTNQLANPNPIDVPEARYGRGVTPDGKQAILVDDQGNYYVGEGTKPENISPSLDALVQEVGDNASGVEGPMDVIISAHKGSVHQHVRELVERLQGVDNIGVIRLGVEERQ
jgi:biopolymer transport protein ExbD